MLTKRDLAINKAAHEILSSYEDWCAEAEQHSQVSQHPLAWFEFMHDKLTAVIESAIKEASDHREASLKRILDITSAASVDNKVALAVRSVAIEAMSTPPEAHQ